MTVCSKYFKPFRTLPKHVCWASLEIAKSQLNRNGRQGTFLMSVYALEKTTESLSSCGSKWFLLSFKLQQ